MQHYVGLDVSLKQTAVCVVDQASKIKREGMIASNPDAIAEFIIAAHDPGRTAQIYDRMFGPGALTPTSGGLAFRAGAATVSILDPTEVATRFGNGVEPSPDGGDRMVALALATKSTTQARAHLDRASILYEPYGSGIVVSAKSAAGVALAFVGGPSPAARPSSW